MLSALAALVAAVDELLVAGPASLTPVERRAMLSGDLQAILPPRAAVALDRVVAFGSVSDLLDLASWARSSLAARSPCALAEGPIVAIAAAQCHDCALEAQPFEAWVRELEHGGAARERAASLLATADREWLRGWLADTVHRRGLDQPPWLERLLAKLGSGTEISDHLIVWAESSPPDHRPQWLAAIARDHAMDDGVSRRWMTLAEGCPWPPALADECVRSLLRARPGMAVDLTFTLFARDIDVARSTFDAVLGAMTLHFEPRFARWARARLESGAASAWQIDALERWIRRNVRE